MKILVTLLTAVAALTATAPSASAQTSVTPEMSTDQATTIEMKTTLGDVTMTLYNDTPLHRDNFRRLVEEGFYNGVLFHRVIGDFMAQAGDPFSRIATPGQVLGEGDPGYTIPAEIRYPDHFHKRGALAAARTSDDINPEKASSGSQFYIVTGKVYNEQQLKGYERQRNRMLEQEILDSIKAENRDKMMDLRRARDFAGITALQDKMIEEADRRVSENPFRLPDHVREAYTTIGGVPHLDGEYTVFGEVTKGMDVIEAITRQPKDRYDRPNDDVRIIEMKIAE